MAAARVLIVDDDPAILAFSRSVLSTQGYDVISVSSGEEALRIVRGNPPFDLILSDFVMPGIQGPELLESIKQAYPSTALLLMTGYAPVPLRGIPVLPKPFSARDLGDAVFTCLAPAQQAHSNLKMELERAGEIQGQAEQIVSQAEEIIRESERIARRLKPNKAE